jgi:hypothetical protein
MCVVDLCLLQPELLQVADALTCSISFSRSRPSARAVFQFTVQALNCLLAESHTRVRLTPDTKSTNPKHDSPGLSELSTYGTYNHAESRRVSTSTTAADMGKIRYGNELHSVRQAVWD